MSLGMISDVNLVDGIIRDVIVFVICQLIISGAAIFTFFVLVKHFMYKEIPAELKRINDGMKEFHNDFEKLNERMIKMAEDVNRHEIDIGYLKRDVRDIDETNSWKNHRETQR